jgi:hypothetical protein
VDAAVEYLRRIYGEVDGFLRLILSLADTGIGAEIGCLSVYDRLLVAV